jgi:hypothetical protein
MILRLAPAHAPAREPAPLSFDANVTTGGVRAAPRQSRFVDQPRQLARFGFVLQSLYDRTPFRTRLRAPDITTLAQLVSSRERRILRAAHAAEAADAQLYTAPTLSSPNQKWAIDFASDGGSENCIAQFAARKYEPYCAGQNESGL